MLETLWDVSKVKVFSKIVCSLSSSFIWFLVARLKLPFLLRARSSLGFPLKGNTARSSILHNSSSTWNERWLRVKKYQKYVKQWPLSCWLEVFKELCSPESHIFRRLALFHQSKWLVQNQWWRNLYFCPCWSLSWYSKASNPYEQFSSASYAKPPALDPW